MACRFRMGTMTPLFVARLFEEHATAPWGPNPGLPGGARQGSANPGSPASGGRSGMRWEAFLDFLLAWEHRGSAAGVRYFFPVLDLRGRGYLTQARKQPHVTPAWQHG